MTVTAERKTYARLPAAVREAVREELLTVRESHGYLPRPTVTAKAMELGVAERTVWRLAQGHGPAQQHRGKFALGDAHKAAIAASPTLKAAWRDLRAAGVAVPSYPHWTRAVGGMDSAVCAGLRHGREALHERQAYLRIEPEHRNQAWSIDHYYVPVRVSWPGFRNPVTPVQTTVMDEQTRMVVASVLWPKPPTAEQALSVVAKAVQGFTTADGTFVGGRPTQLRMDNGQELIGTVMASGLINLRITPAPVRPRGAWEKGKLERWHETLGRECWSLEAGWTGGPRGYEGRPQLVAADRDLPTIDAMRAHLREWVTTYNEQRQHGGLAGKTPLQAWQADPTPLVTSRPELVRTGMLTETRKVLKDGVHLGNLAYLHPELTRNVGHRLTIAYLPDDETFLDVQVSDGTWVRAVPHALLGPGDKNELMAVRAAQEREVTTITRSARKARATRAELRARQDAAAEPTTPAPAPAPAKRATRAPALPVSDPLQAAKVDPQFLLANAPRSARPKKETP